MELRHLRYFERTLSARLFARTKRSVALTPAGELFLAEARKVLDQFGKAESVGRRAGRGEVGRVEIGYVGSAAYAGVLQDQMSRFQSAWPDVDINAREYQMDALPRLISEGEVDIGFLRLPMPIPRSLRLHILLRDRFCLAMPSDHLLTTEAGPLRSSQLGNEAFITPEQTAGTDEVAKRGRFAPNIVSAPGSLIAVLTQVSIGVGISVIPSVVRDIVRLPGVSFRQIAGEPITSEVAAICRSNEGAPAVNNFVRQIWTTPEQRIGSEPRPCAARNATDASG